MTAPLVVAVVWTGTKYGPEYVQRLFNMVERHLPLPFDRACITDHPTRMLPLGVERVEAPAGLPGWWAKMMLYEPTWRAGRRVIYLDLDTVIIGDLTPLAQVEADFAITSNFARIASNGAYPCRYGSCTQVIGPKLRRVWERFEERRSYYMTQAGHYGDQKAVELLCPDLPLLQDLTPPGFFIDRRTLVKNRTAPPPGAAIIVFAGPLKPHNAAIDWITKAWR